MVPPVVDVTSVRFLLAALAGWLNHQQAEAMAYVIEENQTLRAQLGGRRLRLTDDQRRRLAVRGLNRWGVRGCIGWGDRRLPAS